MMKVTVCLLFLNIHAIRSAVLCTLSLLLLNVLKHLGLPRKNSSQLFVNLPTKCAGDLSQQRNLRHEFPGTERQMPLPGEYKRNLLRLDMRTVLATFCGAVQWRTGRRMLH